VDAFDAAMNADPEVRAWALKTLESARIRRATEFKAECAAAREWLIERSYPDVEDDLAVLDAYVAGFDATGRTSASADIRFKASGILAEMPRQTEDQAGVAARQAQPRLPASPLAAGA
jgi:hypothetical protein